MLPAVVMTNPSGVSNRKWADEASMGAIVCTRKPPSETSTHRPGKGPYVSNG
jgi:hypothetical protein